MDITELQHGLLHGFQRRQTVTRCWRQTESGWALRDIAFEEHWDDEQLREVAVQLADCRIHGGTVWCALDEQGRTAAFAALGGEPFGSRHQYLQLVQLHVSAQHRRFGLGAQLLGLAAQRAGECGAKSLYISSHSAQETVAFYHRMGCIDALEPNPALVALEPCDRQMELVLA